MKLMILISRKSMRFIKSQKGTEHDNTHLGINYPKLAAGTLESKLIIP